MEVLFLFACSYCDYPTWNMAFGKFHKNKPEKHLILVFQILHILALAVLALLMRNHNVIMQHNAEFEQNNFLPTPLSKKVKDEDNPYYLPTTQDGRTIYSCKYKNIYPISL